MEIFRAPRVFLIARPEFLEPEHLRVEWRGEALAGGRVAAPFDAQVLGLEELGAGDQEDARGAEDFHQVSGVGGWMSGSRARSSLGTPQAAFRSVSRRRCAMSSGIRAASGPTFRSASGRHAGEGIITSGLRMARAS